MKALVGAFNQEKALVGAFSVIVQLVVELMDRFAALVQWLNPARNIVIMSAFGWYLAPPPSINRIHAACAVCGTCCHAALQCNGTATDG